MIYTAIPLAASFGIWKGRMCDVSLDAKSLFRSVLNQFVHIYIYMDKTMHMLKRDSASA